MRLQRLDTRGFALAAVVISAVVGSIAAFGVLLLGLGARQQATVFHAGRTQARYAAEAGLIWAMHELWKDETVTFDDPFEFDDDGVAATPPILVTIDMETCDEAPCGDRVLSARVEYEDFR